jgi:TolB-like protein/class 3 adenylate cyclase/Flp pilus assembly protein TadD
MERSLGRERVDRRLAAILAADIVGYSRLIGADDEGTHAQLIALHSTVVGPKIKEFRGRVVRTTGDGLLVLFASVVDCLRCAVDIQRDMIGRNEQMPLAQRIVFRMGINVGDVILEGRSLHGDGVNVAARLEALARPGGICVSERVWEDVQGKFELTFEDAGKQHLKNIARPVRIFHVNVAVPAANVPPLEASSRPKLSPETERGEHRPPAALEVAASSNEAARDKSRPPRLSIVVLPFANIGGDVEQEYFVDGVTESLTTDLSRMGGMQVIGRNTAFTYKGKSLDLKLVGQELNVRYVLEGSVQRGSNRIRVNAQLIDTETGTHLWAERFDKPVVDLFDMQDEIVARLAAQLGTQLIGAEARRAERAPNPDSLDFYFQGMACLARGNTPEHLSQARGYFERALTLDAGNIEALVSKAYVDTLSASLYATDDRSAKLAGAEAALTSALSSAPEHAWAHLCLGLVQIQTNRAVQGIAECERALALDRNLAPAHATIGLAKYRVGRSEETEAHIQEAFRLSPRDTFGAAWMSIAGDAKLFLGNDEEAVTRLSRAIEMNRNNPYTYFLLAAALANLDRLDEARFAAQAGLALAPSFSMGRFLAGAASDNPTFLAQRERVVAGLRKAGVPEV